MIIILKNIILKILSCMNVDAQKKRYILLIDIPENIIIKILIDLN
jgi:hypothetical protein